MAAQTGSVATDRYLALIHRFPLRRLRDDAELDLAIAIVDALVDRDDLDPSEEEYLDVLGDLVERYEQEHHPIPPATDAELLRYLIESREVTQAQVAAGTGIAESTISEVLAGKRALNRRHITELARFFRVDPGAFLSS